MKIYMLSVIVGLLTITGTSASQQTSCNASLVEDLRDDLFTASSRRSEDNGPSAAKMSQSILGVEDSSWNIDEGVVCPSILQQEPFSTGGWIASGSRKDEFLQVDFDRTVEITSLRLWPVNTGWQVRSARISYSNDGLVWTAYNSRLSTDILGEIFVKYFVSTYYMEIVLDPTIQARYLAVNPNPVRYYVYPALKLEVFGCNMTASTAPSVGMTVDRNIESDVVWIPSQSPVLIDRPIVVSPTVTLSVQAGVSVVFTHLEAGLIVYGHLNTTGLSGVDVQFTSNYPVLSTSNKWKGIQQTAAGTINLLYTTVRQAETGIQGNGSNTLIDSCQIFSCNEGIKLSNGLNADTDNLSINSTLDLDVAVVKDTAITFCLYGLVVHGVTNKELFVVRGCTFANSSWGIYMYNWDNINNRDIYTVLVVEDSEMSDNSFAGLYNTDITKMLMYFKNTRIRRNRNYGVYVLGYNQYTVSQTIRIDNCTVSDHSQTGLYIYCQNCNGAYLMIQNSSFVKSNIYINQQISNSHLNANNVQVASNNFSGDSSKVPLQISVNTADSIYIYLNKFNMTNRAIVLNWNGGSQEVYTIVSYNTFYRIHGQYVINADADNINLYFMANHVYNVTVRDIVYIQKGFISMAANNFTSNSQVTCSARIQHTYDPDKQFHFNHNYWGSSDITMIRSKICDFFLDSSKLRVNITFIYDTPEMTSLLDTQNSDTFNTYYDETSNAYIVGGVIYEDTIVDDRILQSPIIVNRSIIVMENATVSLAEVQVKFAENRGVVTHGHLVIGREDGNHSTLESSETNKLWNGLTLYSKDLLLVNTRITGSKLLIDSKHGFEVNILNSSVTDSKKLLSNNALNGNGSLTIRNSIIDVTETMVFVSLNFTKTVNVTVVDSILKSKHNVIYINKQGSVSKLNDIGIMISRSNLTSGRDLLYVDHCQTYLLAGITDSYFETTSRVFAIQPYATDFTLSNSTLRGHKEGQNLKLCSRPQEKKNISRTYKIEITGCQFVSASRYGYDFQLNKNRYNDILDHEYHIHKNIFTDLAKHSRKGIVVTGYGSQMDLCRSCVISNNSFLQYATAIDIIGDIDHVSIHNNTCKNGKQFIKALFQGRNFRKMLIGNNTLTNNTNDDGVIQLLQPYTGNATIELTHNTFVNNTGAIVSFTSPYIVIHYNFFENNQSLYNLKVLTPSSQYQDKQANASLNYWGTDDIGAISRKIYDQDYDTSLFDVIVRPYLGSKNTSDIQDKVASFISDTGDIGGTVNGDVTLTADRSPYRVISNIDIQVTDQLTVEAGVKLLFDRDLGIKAKGALNISGTVKDPVVMTAHSSFPWNGIEINANSSSSLSNLMVNSTVEGVIIKDYLTVVHNVTSNFSSKSGIDISLDNPMETDLYMVFDGLAAYNNTHAGITVDIIDEVKRNVSISLNHCKTVSNGGSGINIKANASVKLFNCDILHNGQSGIYVAQANGGNISVQASNLVSNRNRAVNIERTTDFILNASVIRNHVRNYYYRQQSIILSKYYRYSSDEVYVGITNNVFKNNTADGMKWYIRSTISIQVVNNTFTGGRRIFYSQLSNGQSRQVNITFSDNTIVENSESENALIKVDFRYSMATLHILNNNITNNVLSECIGLNGYDFKIAPQIEVTNNIFKQNVVSKNLIYIRNYPQIVITHNSFMSSGDICEIMPPPFISSSFYINATRNYWNTRRVIEVAEKVCGFDTNMAKSFVYYMPFYVDQDGVGLDVNTHDMFNIDGAIGGEIAMDTSLSDILNTDHIIISRSILIRNGSSLNIRQGSTLKFEKGRGIYAEGSLQLLGGGSVIKLTSSQSDEAWYGILLNPKSGISVIEDTWIQNSQNGVHVMSKLIAIRRSAIDNSSTNCLTLATGLDNVLDLQGTHMSNCKMIGIAKTGAGNVTLINMTITDSKQGFVDHSRSGNVILRSCTISNISLEAVSIKNKHSYKADDVIIEDSKITNTSVGVAVHVRNYEGNDYTKIDRNTFTNITGKAVSVSFVPWNSEYNSAKAGNVSIGFNSFYNTCGANFVSANFGNFSFHDNTIVNSTCLILGQDVHFLDIQINSNLDIPYHVFDISSNFFFNVTSSYLARIAETTNAHAINGSIQYNRFLDISTTMGVFLLDTKIFRISENIFDSPKSPYDIYMVKTGKEVINASYNWWGRADMSYAQSRIYDRQFNPDLLSVNITPILTEQSQDCSGVNNCSSNGECISKNRCRCYSGWKGQTCSEYYCDGVRGCYGNGVCIGPNQCQCDSGWSGQLCIMPSCSEVNDCSEHGICVRPNTCTCANRYTGSDCSACIEAHWGPACQPCPLCVHGTCNLETGGCVCSAINWAGQLCDRCNETFYGKDCLRLPLTTVLAIIPSQGVDKGGNTVHVWGHNFPEPNGTVYTCRFGDDVVNGTWLAWNHVTCAAPQHVEGAVTVEISPDGESYTDNKLRYLFYASCPPGSCGKDLSPPHGYCMFGSCSCRLPWAGDNCDRELLAPVIASPPAQQTVAESSKYSYILRLQQGEPPIRWMLDLHPKDMTIDERTAILQWDYAFAKTTPYTVKVTATNIVGQDSVEWQIEVPVSYSVDVVSITPSGDLATPSPVLITGSVQFNNSMNAKVVPVDVLITNKRIGQVVLPVLTNPLNPTTFEATYYPRPDDAGGFTAAAKHPAMVTAEGAALSWRVEGMKVNPAVVRLDGLIDGDEVVFQNISTLINTGGLFIQDITSKVEGLPGSYVRQHGSGSIEALYLDHLAADASHDLDLVVDHPRPLSGAIHVVFTSPTGLTTRLIVYIRLYVKKPLLIMDPPSLTADIHRGTQKVINVQICNIGEVTARNVKASLPNDPRLSIVAFSLVNSTDTVSGNDDELVIPTQKNALLTLAVTSSPSDGLGEMSGRIAINTNLTASYISYKFYITSLQILTLNVTVTDEYTYFASDKPHVAGAKIQLTNPRRNYRQVLFTTNETGTVQFDDVYEDRYTLYVEAENHASYSAVIITSSDKTNIETFLKRTSVKYDWTVTPTTVKDEYIIKLDSTFETFVPMPVVTIEPAKVNTIPYELEEEDTIEFTITNHGLIRADNVRFVLPTSHPYLTFHSTIDTIGNLEANSTIVVPVKTKLKTRVKRSFISEVVCGLLMLYDLLCGNLRTYDRAITLTREYPGRPPLPCGLSGPGGDPGPVGERGPRVYTDDSGPGTPGGTRVDYTPVTPLSCDCLKALIKTCVLGLNTVTGCTASATDVMTAYSDDRAHGDFILGTLNLISGLADSAFACVFGVLCDRCGKLYTAVRCWQDVDDKCSSDRRRREVSSGVAQNLLNAGKPLDNFLDIMGNILGDERMYDLSTSWYGTFKAAVADDSDNGTLLSSGEFGSILNNLSEDPDRDTLALFLHRWNNTAAAWTNGSLNELAHTGRVIDIARLEPKIDQYIVDVRAANTRNYSSIFDEFDYAFATYTYAEEKEQKSGDKKNDGVCAKVRIRIEQNLVLTRSAFNAKLEIENGENTDLDDIKVEIEIRQTYGTGDIDNDKFSIGSPKLVGISAVDGTGTLRQDLSGTAEWLIIPYNTASPTEDTLYDIGGRLSYRVGSSEFSVPLLPDTLTVKSNPSLVVHYFHEKYVRGDDPLTSEIEPIIPFSLCVMVMNDGYGVANALKISSAQPEIIENEKGLLVSFKIIGVRLGDDPVAPSLTVDFGDIHSFETKTAQWLLTSTLKGTFYNYSATFENINPLGDPQLSLLEELGYHELIHLVSMANSEDDLVDFLVNDFIDDDGMPDMIYNSDNGSDVSQVHVAHVKSIEKRNFIRSGSKSYLVISLNISIENQTQWFYLRFENNISSPLPGDNQHLLQVARHDGKHLLVNTNAWQTTHIQDRFYIHIFDENDSQKETNTSYLAQYDLTYGPKNMYSPRFNMSHYSVTIPPDFDREKSVLAVHAYDIDKDDVQFSMKDSTYDMFTISESGEIFLNTSVETKTSYEFQILVTDHGIPSKSADTTVLVYIDSDSTATTSTTTTLGPNVATTLGPNVTTTLGPNVTTTLGPNVTTTLGPNVTATLGSNVTTTLGPNVTTTLGPNVTTTLVPNVTTLGPNVTTTLGPNVTATLGSNVTTTLGPNVTTTLGPNVTTTLVPNVTTLGPNVTTTLGPNVTTLGPNVTTTLGPNVTTTLGPNVTTTLEPNVTTTLGQNVTITLGPNVTTTLGPNVTKTIGPNVTSSSMTSTPSTTTADSSQTTSPTIQDGKEEKLSSWVIPTAIGGAVIILIVIFVGVFIWLLRMKQGGSNL